MDEKAVQLNDFNNSAWELMRVHVKDIGRFLSTREQTPEMPNIIAISVKLVLSEIVMNLEKYEKYPARIYSDEEFVDMVIDSMVNGIPDIKDVEATESYIDAERKIIWGHIKMHVKRITEILHAMGNPHEEDAAVKEKDGDIFLECLTTVWVECLLRDRETRILEDTYGE
jgi:hypothetical protein